MEVFFLSCSKQVDGGGIYKYRLTDEGKLVQVKYLPCENPMYGVYDSERLHILLREPFKNKNSGYFSANLELEELSDINDTKGIVACHLAVDGKDNYIVNYLSGNIVKNCHLEIRHFGKGVDPLRQGSPHTHCVIFSNDKKYVIVTDLGLDTVFSYDRDLDVVSYANVPKGYGVRHAVFSQCGNFLYAINELVPSISVFSFCSGILEYCSSIPLPCTNKKANGAAIKLSENGKHLYCSVREENAIFVYEINGVNLRFLQKNDCGGDSPRDFDVYKNLLICTNENSGVTVFDLNNEYISVLTQKIDIKNPLCVIFNPTYNKNQSS